MRVPGAELTGGGADYAFDAMANMSGWNVLGPTPPPGGCAAEWKQCGGKDYTGSTDCKDGFMCVVQSEWYSQCVPTKKA